MTVARDCLVDLVAEVVGGAERAAAAQRLVDIARSVRAVLARRGVPARVSGDIGGEEAGAPARRIVVVLRVGRYLGAPPQPSVLHPLVPRDASQALARAVSGSLRATTGKPWPPVWLWGALSVAKGDGGSTPAPSVSLYFGDTEQLAAEDGPSLRDAIARGVFAAVEEAFGQAAIRPEAYAEPAHSPASHAQGEERQIRPGPRPATGASGGGHAAAIPTEAARTPGRVAETGPVVLPEPPTHLRQPGVAVRVEEPAPAEAPGPHPGGAAAEAAAPLPPQAAPEPPTHVRQPAVSLRADGPAEARAPYLGEAAPAVDETAGVDGPTVPAAGADRAHDHRHRSTETGAAQPEAAPVGHRGAEGGPPTGSAPTHAILPLSRTAEAAPPVWPRHDQGVGRTEPTTAYARPAAEASSPTPAAPPVWPRHDQGVGTTEPLPSHATMPVASTEAGASLPANEDTPGTPLASAWGRPSPTAGAAPEPAASDAPATAPVPPEPDPPTWPHPAGTAAPEPAGGDGPDTRGSGPPGDPEGQRAVDGRPSGPTSSPAVGNGDTADAALGGELGTGGGHAEGVPNVVRATAPVSPRPDAGASGAVSRVTVGERGIASEGASPVPAVRARNMTQGRSLGDPSAAPLADPKAEQASGGQGPGAA